MGKYIKPISRLLTVTFFLMILGACSSGSEDQKAIQLNNQDNQLVTVAGDKPAVLFFFTTYT